MITCILVLHNSIHSLPRFLILENLGWIFDRFMLLRWINTFVHFIDRLDSFIGGEVLTGRYVFKNLGFQQSMSWNRHEEPPLTCSCLKSVFHCPFSDCEYRLQSVLHAHCMHIAQGSHRIGVFSGFLKVWVV